VVDNKPLERQEDAKINSSYVLTIVEFETFSTTIENLKTPLGHVSPMGKYIHLFLVGSSHLTTIF
jgi:hypothetical protein